MANVYDSETDELIKYAPRNLMKKTISEREGLEKIKSQILFSFILHKYGKEEKEQHHISNRGMLTLE